MKKKTFKLALHRETLANLSNRQMEEVAGVAATNDKSCLLSCFAGCSAVGCTDTCPRTIVRTCTC
ncbi:MAG: class I lanthipeptide [Acidobacteria bacterium]|nr:class I lanthipeptide [Acidobacteriota bacterium]